MVNHIHSTVHRRYPSLYREFATLPITLAYLKKKHDWNENTATTIQWGWFKNATRRYTHATKNHLTKLVYDQLATPRKSVAGGKAWVISKCPYCHKNEETFQHMIRCNHPESAIFRTKVLQTVDSVCYQRRAPHAIHTTLRSWIATWLRNETPSVINLDHRLHQLHAAQSEIGWDLLIRGFNAAE